jgi:predicted transcriptional regulator
MKTMSIHKLRVQAKIDRGQACLRYMKTRTSPVTLKDLASKLGVTTKSISNSLMPLLEEGLIVREREFRQSSVCNKLGWAYVYYDAEKRNKMRRVKQFKINYHDPFNMTARA